MESISIVFELVEVSPVEAEVLVEPIDYRLGYRNF